MTAIMNNANAYLDFFDIAVDAYKHKQLDIYRKIMTTLIASYKSLLYEVEIENSNLENEVKLAMNRGELDHFYDTMYDMVDLLKLLKKHLSPLKESDGLFKDLYEITDKLHVATLHHIDIVSTQEVVKIQKHFVKAS